MKPIFEKVDAKEGIEALFDVTDMHSDEALQALVDLPVPKRSTKMSAGYDFYMPYDVAVRQGEVVKIPLLIKATHMPKDCVLMIFNRSGLSLKYGLRLDNAVGIIDPDYERCIWFQATANQDITLRKGDKICQGIFLSFLTTKGDRAKGKRYGGFGSTGR